MKNRLLLIVALTGFATNAMEKTENDYHIISYKSPIDNYHMDFIFLLLTKYYENALIFPENCLDTERERGEKKDFYDRIESLCADLQNFQNDAKKAVLWSLTCKRAYYKLSPCIKNTMGKMSDNILRSSVIIDKLLPMATDYYYSKHTEQKSPYELYSLTRLVKYPIVLHYMGKILTQPNGFIEESLTNYRRYLIHKNFAKFATYITKCHQNILNQPVGPFGCGGSYIESKERMDPGLKLLETIAKGAFKASGRGGFLVKTQDIDRVAKLNPYYTNILPFKLVKKNNDVYCESKELQTEDPYNYSEQYTVYNTCSII